MLKRGCSKRDKTFVIQNAIRVMVVDNNKGLLAYVGDSLKSHSFEVTCVDRAGDALKILVERKVKYDILFIDSELKDVDVVTFLRFAKQMDIPSMVMHEEADDNFIFKMLASGALLVVERPLSEDVFIRIRQCVIREHLNKLESECSTDGKKNVTMSNNKRNSSIQLHKNGTDFSKKKSLEWTKELHSNFLRVTHQLAGEGRCFPKDILVGMGVPGLTRMQVASHLQNCRRGGLKFTENQGLPSASRNGSSNGSQEEVNSKHCGHTPVVVNSVENQEEIKNFIDGTLSGNEVEKYKDLMNNQSFIGSSSWKNYGFQNHGQVGSKRCKKGFNPRCFHQT